MTDHIKIASVLPRIQYVADGTTTDFSFSFAIFREDNLAVFINEERIWSGYAVHGAGSSSGGLVGFAQAPADGAVVTLMRMLTIQRTTDFQESGMLMAKVLNDELDVLTAALQEVAAGLARTVRLSPTDHAALLQLPERQLRAGCLLGFDGEGNLQVVAPPRGGGGAGAGGGPRPGGGWVLRVRQITLGRGRLGGAATRRPGRRSAMGVDSAAMRHR
ncbi:MAG: hypothetical protein EA406_09855 [Rhodospirillales bacterium]|nr:MAG: hypothetical protein EA406_09855 [Rhodospirillales bacterium]